MIAPLLLTLLSRFPGFERELRLLPNLLRPGRVAVDIGAALGVYALPMAALVGATGAVLAFEPRPQAATRIRRLASTFGFDHLQVHAAALGARPGHQQLVVPRRRRPVPGRSFLHPGSGTMALDDRLQPGRVLDVPVSTLDHARSASDRSIDFVKCDVEGAEHDVFTGGHDVLTGDRPTVLCEIEDRHARRYGGTVQRVLDLFSDYEYRPVDLGALGCAPRNMLLIPRERSWPSIVAGAPQPMALARTDA